jgi:hypothetical protein
MFLSQEDYRKYYQPKAEPSLLDVPSMTYVVINGSGDPNGEEFAQATEALYSLAYAVKMSYKKPSPPKGYYEYKVFPLEGEWDLVDTTKPLADKSNYSYQLMIQQPDFLTQKLFDAFLAETRRKKNNPKLEKLRLETIADGLCCQMLHLGPYDAEPASFAKMHAFCDQQGYRRLSKTHKEIYLSDPRKTVPEKMKTILRFQVGK